VYLLYIVLFLFPFYKSTFSVEVGIITFNPYSIGIIALALLAMAQNIFTTRKYGVNLVDIFLMLFCLSFFVSTLLSPNIVKSGSMAYRWVFLPVISYFVIKTFVEGEDQFMKALFFLLAGTVVFSILGLMDIGITTRRHLILSMPPIGAATLAAFVLITIFYSGWWRKKIGFVSLVFSALLLFLTYSRIYLIAILISPLLFYLIIRRGHIIKLFVLLFPVSLILALGLSVTPTLFMPKFNPSKEARTISRVVDIQMYKKSIYNRARQYREGLHGLAKHPVIGTGIKHGRTIVTTHNFHIEWLEYGGLLGYMFGVGIFASYFLIQRPYVTKDRFCAVNMCIISIVLINCFFNGIMHGIMPYVIFIIMGMGEARRKIIEQEAEHFGLSAGLTLQSERA
jgi:hypothetical protein